MQKFLNHQTHTNSSFPSLNNFAKQRSPASPSNDGSSVLIGGVSVRFILCPFCLHSSLSCLRTFFLLFFPPSAGGVTPLLLQHFDVCYRCTLFCNFILPTQTIRTLTNAYPSSPPLPFPLPRHNVSLSTALSAPASLSIEQVARDLDIGSLQRNLTNIAFCDIEAEDLRNVDQHVVKLFKLAQLMYVHESTILFL